MENAVEQLTHLSLNFGKNGVESSPSSEERQSACRGSYRGFTTWSEEDSPLALREETSPGTATGSNYGGVLRKQASELESALMEKSSLEAEIRRLSGELSTVKIRLAQKDSELQQAESQLRQRSPKLPASDEGQEDGGLTEDSPETMDLKAERDALQAALRAAQLELAREQAARVSAEAKAASLASGAPPSPARRAPEGYDDAAALKEQLESEKAEVAALQESLRRAEQEWNASHQEAVSLKDEKANLEDKMSGLEAEADRLVEREKRLQRMLDTKDETIRELSEKLEQRAIESMSLGSSGRLGEEDMWKLGLTLEQISAVDRIIESWRESYNAKTRELQEVTSMVQEREDQLSRVKGIVRRTMDSIRASYQRSSRDGTPTRDESLLDASQFNGVEEMLGSLAQFAANKSYTVMRLEQELGRKRAEVEQLEEEVQRSWVSSHKESELEYARRELEQKTAECTELRASLSRKTEEFSAAQVELRVMHEEVQSAQDAAAHAQSQLRASEEEMARVRREASNAAMQDVTRMREDLEKAHAEVLPLKEQLNRRTREVRELNHMLKAWEAMRLGKDAQIASLMERCKRHEEEAAEKARSVDSLRRKLALAGRDTSLNNSLTSSRARHIHVHMHHQPSEAGSEYDYNGMGASSSVRSSPNY
mmetsp:Transcript_10478/g.24788  ORF Transcript_10478/g.24788 Transcript_10478/m.24788 type:complete len:655 (+) Transcript_10478:228-2192(+)